MSTMKEIHHNIGGTWTVDGLMAGHRLGRSFAAEVAKRANARLARVNSELTENEKEILRRRGKARTLGGKEVFSVSREDMALLPDAVDSGLKIRTVQLPKRSWPTAALL